MQAHLTPEHQIASIISEQKETFLRNVTHLRRGCFVVPVVLSQDIVKGATCFSFPRQIRRGWIQGGGHSPLALPIQQVAYTSSGSRNGSHTTSSRKVSVNNLNHYFIVWMENEGVEGRL